MPGSSRQRRRPRRSPWARTRAAMSACSTSATMAPDSTWLTLESYLHPFSVCTKTTSSRAPASVSRPCSVSYDDTVGAFGQKALRRRAQPSFLRSPEKARTSHDETGPIGGRQRQRREVDAVGVEEMPGRKSGGRRPRRSRSARLPVCHRFARDARRQSSSDVGFAGSQAAKDRWSRGPATHSRSRQNERLARGGPNLVASGRRRHPRLRFRGQRLRAKARRLRRVRGCGKDARSILAHHQRGSVAQAHPLNESDSRPHQRTIGVLRSEAFRSPVARKRCADPKNRATDYRARLLLSSSWDRFEEGASLGEFWEHRRWTSRGNSFSITKTTHAYWSSWLT